MQFKQISLLLLIGVLVLVVVVVVAAQDEAVEPTTATPPEEENGGGLLTFFLAPIRATIKSARRLFQGPADTIEQVRLKAFEMFMQLYNKTYAIDEIPRRMALFQKRREIIEESVRMFREGKSMFAMRLNQYTDWDEQEIKMLAGVSLPSKEELHKEELEAEEQTNSTEITTTTTQTNSISNDDDEEEEEEEKKMIVKADTTRIPAYKDWRNTGCVGTPINQLKCGACYAIATMGVVESMRCIKQVSSPTLSPQQIVDCSTPRAGYDNHGCDGGWPTRVLKYLQDVRIAARETCYPFVRRQNACKLRQVRSSSGCTISASPRDGSRLQYKLLNNERDILYHVANTGPVITVMQASDKFLYYDKGIFDDKSCSRRREAVDHAIVIVGYGRENGTDYWIIKNSWGTTDWGQGGYGLYKRGTNACSIGYYGWVVTA